jgi:hypothetical protein
MNNKDEEYYGIRELMDPVVRNTVNLIGFGRFLELTMQCVCRGIGFNSSNNE